MVTNHFKLNSWWLCWSWQRHENIQFWERCKTPYGSLIGALVLQMFSSVRLGGRGLARGLYLHHQAPSARLLSSSPCLLQSELAKLRKKTGYSLSICKKVTWSPPKIVALLFLVSWIQALGETGNDGEAAEKWLAEQAQVDFSSLSDYPLQLVRIITQALTMIFTQALTIILTQALGLAKASKLQGRNTSQVRCTLSSTMILNWYCL